MSSATKYASALQQYNHFLMNTQQKIMQERSVHGQELTNVYMQAVAAGAPPGYLSMLEAMIADRSTYNMRKTFVDAAELTKHGKKLNVALGPHVGVLAGGAAGLRGGADSREGRRALGYAAKRSNALLENLFTKLAHDRAVHLAELHNVHAEALAAYGGASPLSTMINAMVNDRTKYNARKEALDAMQWTQLNKQLGSGGLQLHSVLAAGQKKM